MGAPEIDESGESPEESAAKPLPEQLRAQLREARKAKGLSQAELGKLLGITGTQVYRIESGQRGSRLTTVQRWLQECGWTADYTEISIEESERKSLLLAAIADLDKDHLASVLAVVSAWPKLTVKERRAILSLIEPSDP